MDNGAHFYKTDFQVHTPRDLQWNGNDAVTDDERKTYAEELIHACRQKNLNAIAITDHHDFVFFPFVKRAALDELDDSGVPIPDDQKIIVFPGIEMTLEAPPCQALLILDANFPETSLASVLTTLSIATAPATESKTLPVQAISTTVAQNFERLYTVLSSQDFLKGKFIIFPNITDGGLGTLLRAHFQAYYKSMPCVGGYADKAVSRFGQGVTAIISGKDRAYGFKSVGVFQTSDNRLRDHSRLGTNATWVKLSEPTAEALRQACLAKESRLSQEDPLLPNLWISSMSVSASKFLGRLETDFNLQYNALIGGRGTGKSTILEYLRWGLCDQPTEETDPDAAGVQAKRRELIEKTLTEANGQVIITFFLNGVKHILKRKTNPQEILLKIGDGAFAQATEQEVRNLFPVQAYSQKQLSSVGVRIQELKRFVELPVKRTLDQISSDLRDIEVKIRSVYGNRIRKKEVESEIAKYDLEIKSLATQLTLLRGALKGLSSEDQEVIRQKSSYDNEELIVANLKNEIDQLREGVEVLMSSFAESSQEPDEDTVIQNEALIAAIRKKYMSKTKEIGRGVDAIHDLFKPTSLKEINDEIKKWETVKREFDKKYETAKTRAKANEQVLKEIAVVEARVTQLNKLQLANRNALKTLGDPDSKYTELKAAWNEFHAKKLQSLSGQCEEFTALSKGFIAAEVDKSADEKLLQQKIKIAFSGLNIKEDKIDALCQYVVSQTDPIVAWNEVLADLEKLAIVSETDATQVLLITKILDTCHFIPNEKARLISGFNTERWLDLSLVELEFNPIFRYCTNTTTNEYIPFSHASAGQQATALLTVLLNQSGGPLIIDQPEDDIDSKMSQEIVKQIWNAKNHRQLIFASHNANMVVNGDAELVICCDYVRAGDQTGGKIKYAGAIDNATIRTEIATVTEGGMEAFKLRKEKYGF